MKKICLFTLLTIFNIMSQSIELPIVPVPQIIQKLETDFVLPDKINILLTGIEPESSKFTAELIQKTLKIIGVTSTIKTGKGEAGDIVLYQYENRAEDNLKVFGGMTDEGYYLNISKDGISIKSSTPRGMYYGAMSLIQLLEKVENKKLEGVNIIDWPDMKVRGISDDISRGQVSTLDNFKKIIEHIARYKMNTYMPYLEDMLEFKSYPSIGKNRGALTRLEVKELHEFASKHFVDIIPVFQTLGHYENILVSDEFLPYAEFPGAASLNVSYDSTYIFLENMLKEVFDMFPSEYFHMGADESWDVGLGKSKHLVDEHGIAMVHAMHYQKVYDICKKYGKNVIMYSDILLNHPDILEVLPKDIIIVNWHYRAWEDYPSTRTFNQNGFEYYVSPSVWNFVTTFPTNINALPNIQYITKAGLIEGSTGMINSNWGDYGAETFKEFVLYGYAWSAQCAWNYKESNITKFNKDYFYDFFGINDSRLENIYTALSHSLNQMMWHEVWRHPLLPYREATWWEQNVSPVVRINWMDLTLPQLRNDIIELQKSVKRNGDHFTLLSFMLDLNDWYKIKLEVQILLHRILNKLSADKNEVIKLVDKNIEMLQSLKKDYRNLWLTYYKEENLFMVEDKFNRLIAYFTETKSAISEDNIISPVIQSKWIYNSINEKEFESKASFKKEFNLDKIPDSALLQFIGDTYVQLYINGKYVDRVYARRSLSLLVDYHRIKLIDVTPYLVNGKNQIEVKAENFNTRGSAGVNIVTNIISIDNEVIMTDESWSTKAIDNEWKSITVKNYPLPVIAPNFETRRTSWIER